MIDLGSDLPQMAVEIAESEDPFYIYKALSPEPKSWEVAGKIAFLGCAFVGFSAFVPALLKKGRVYTFSPVAAPNLPPPADMVVDAEAPLPDFRCNPEENRKINELFTTIAEGGADLALPWVAYRLTQLGNEIDHVHPFGLLLALPRERICQILRGGNPLKVGSFTRGLGRGMERELAQNNIDRHLPSLAAEIGKEEPRIKQLIQGGDWLALAHYLFDIPA